MTDSVARTALLTAAERARESARPDRLFDDPLSDLLAGEQGAAMLEAQPREATNRVMAIRTRYFDNWLEEATSHEIRQVVLLGAGMDARAFRLSWPAGTRLWEVDRPDLLATKTELLNHAGATPTCLRDVVGVDLASDAWPEELRHAGYEPARRSVWLGEGLLVYFDAGQVERLLLQIASVACAGSWLGADFVSESFLRSPFMQPWLRWLDEQGASWRYGTDRPEDILAKSGWHATAVRQPGEDGVGAGLLPWPVPPRELPDMPRSFLVTAER